MALPFYKMCLAIPQKMGIESPIHRNDSPFHRKNSAFPHKLARIDETQQLVLRNAIRPIMDSELIKIHTKLEKLKNAMKLCMISKIKL